MTEPSSPGGVKQMSARDLQALRTSGARFELLDVRTTGERAIAHIEGARLLDRPTAQALEKLPRETPLVFQCHHGVRSQAAAQHFVALGFTDVSNLVGGIEAWSLEVDPSVPRY